MYALATTVALLFILFYFNLALLDCVSRVNAVERASVASVVVIRKT